MNEAIKNMIERRSVRSYQEKQITKGELDLIIEAGKYAATGADRQPILFIAVQDKETIKTLTKMNAEIMGKDIDPYYGAPTIVLVLAKKEVGTRVEDGSLVIGNMMNAAYSLGVGSCWIHREKEMFEREDGKALLKKWGVEGEYQGVGACILGYPAEEAAPASPRKEQVIYI